MHSIKYLGVQIPLQLQKLYELNYCPLLNNMQQGFKTMSSMPHSWLGRISLLKMDSLHRFLYIFQLIPIRIPCLSFWLAHSILLKFIWSRSSAWVWYPSEGETLVEQVCITYLYYTTALLSSILDWFHHGPFTQWVILKSDLSPVPLSFLPWLLPMDHLPLPQLTLPLSSLLYTWDKAITTYSLSSCLGPLTRFWAIQSFYPGGQICFFFCWQPLHPSPIQHVNTLFHKIGSAHWMPHAPSLPFPPPRF